MRDFMKSSKKRVEPLSFQLFSGGSIRIDRQACLSCKTQACVRHCVSSTLDPVLKIEKGVPVLSRSDVRPESGWCVECLACELDCGLYGRRAVQIIFDEPMEDNHVDSR